VLLFTRMIVYLMIVDEVLLHWQKKAARRRKVLNHKQ